MLLLKLKFLPIVPEVVIVNRSQPSETAELDAQSLAQSPRTSA